MNSSEVATAVASLPTSTQARKGYLLAAGAAVMWGTSGVIARFLFSTAMRPFDLLLIRTLSAALIYWLFCLVLSAGQGVLERRLDRYVVH